jgi:hypothetical protein
VCGEFSFLLKGMFDFKLANRANIVKAAVVDVTATKSVIQIAWHNNGRQKVCGISGIFRSRISGIPAIFSFPLSREIGE